MFGQNVLRRPSWALTGVFAAWKSLLFAVALGSCVGPTYDTSASLAFAPPPIGPGLALAHGNQTAPTLVTRLTSWDAIYYMQAARRGYVFEQEWAFGSGLPMLIACLVKALTAVGIQTEPHALEPLVAVIVANVSHLLSVLALHGLGLAVWRDAKLAFAAAALHVFSPAGLFLSAPCPESTFSLLSFTGYLLFAHSCPASARPTTRDALTILAGVSFGVATAFRSNGILNGLPFAWECVRLLPSLPRQPTSTLRRLVVLGVSGLCVGLGSVIPQWVAYQRFCSGASAAELRPWCVSYLPSIYTFVQEHYWNVGFLRYWTLSNAPLFLLATPMLYIMITSGLRFLGLFDKAEFRGQRATSEEKSRLTTLVQSAALAQVVLAVLAFTTYHVQIITRISSGSPLWYFWLASSLGTKATSGGGKPLVVFMVMYAAIQGVLFASFLPPA